MQSFGWFWQGDAVTRIVALALLAMSVASWVTLLWKAWLLRRASADVLRGIAAFWQAGDLATAAEAVRPFDRETLVQPLAAAAASVAARRDGPAGLDVQVAAEARLTRALRGALLAGTRRLQAGQTLLATVGSTAPFVGLLGTVWGIYHALTGIAAAGQITIDRIAGPVGEALVMTAAGLAVAIPAVLAYNVFNRSIGRIEAELEGFAHDLLAFGAVDAAQGDHPGPRA